MMMPGLLVDFSVALALLYVLLLSIKHIVKGFGTTRTLGLVSVFFFIPSVVIIRWFKTQDVALSSLIDASPWWILSFQGKDAETTVNIDLVTLALVFSLLYLVGFFLVNLLTVWSNRVRGRQFQDLHRGLILWLFVLAGLLIYSKIMGLSLTPILFGMGAVSIVIGLAIQEPLSNFFAGLALDIEGFIRPGDWIRVDTEGGTIGQVVEKGWRTTRLLTINRELVTLPNRVIGAQKILNYHLPETYHAHRLKVSASYGDPPMKVKEILTSIMLEHQKILDEPKPQVLTENFSDSAVEYEMEYFLEDFGCSERVRNDLLTRIWYEFRKHQVQIPYPTRAVQIKSSSQLNAEEESINKYYKRIVTFLQGIPQISSHLSDQDIELVAMDATECKFGPKELIIRKGARGDSTYLVKDGWCQLALPDGTLKRLKPGEYFGEMAMLSGQPRTTDIFAGPEGVELVRIGRETLFKVFDKYPQVRAEFDQTREHRLLESKPLVVEDHTHKTNLAGKFCQLLKEHFVPW